MIENNDLNTPVVEQGASANASGMLEIRNITKIYRSKTGEEVRALDNVSIQFPESGMVFLLGKSGSGKSTLLNVIGGLDSYDEGEFIIKGKSSKEFAGSDFDAYRNTFIGFIFQEYNILDDFSVGANIALALELQGKKASSEAVEGILSQVDLVGYAHRKPNELSGGQKQRVAIARALVKEPQIIMADEPTGALDSNTGKQIFDALKVLSREKLVIIVSHDRDFAEKYADRIIELSDGRVIEDVTKHEHEAERLSDGVHRVNDHILRIESGYRLTAKDLEMINEYLAKNSGDVLLSGDARVNDELRAAVGISREGASTVFEGTDPAKDIKKKKYDKGETKFIRSRLPMKNALKMGSSGLKHKKFRLFMTILLSFIAFAMFGLANSMAAYEKVSAATESIIDSQIRSAAMSLSVRYNESWSDGKNSNSYVGYQGTAFNDADIAWLEQQTGLEFVPVFTGYSSAGRGESGINIQHQFANYESNTVYNARLSGLAAVTAEQLATTGYQVTGRLPENANEIAITEFMYRQFNEYGFQNEVKGETVEKGKLTMDDHATTGIIGKHITINQIGWSNLGQDQRPTYTIVGIVNTNFNYERYQNLLPRDENQPSAQEEESLIDMFLSREVTYERDFGFHALGFVTEDAVTPLAAYMAQMGMQKEFGTYMDMANMGLRLVAFRSAEIEGDQPDSLSEFDRVAKLEDLKTDQISWFEPGKNTLGENEVLISARRLQSLLPEHGKILFDADRIAAFNAMGAQVYGEAVWAKAMSAAQATGRSYYDQLAYAEALAYIAEVVPTLSTEILNREFGTEDAAAAAATWEQTWVNNGDLGWGVNLNDGYMNFYNAYNNRSLMEKAVMRDGVQNYLFDFFGMPKPAIVDVEKFQSAFVTFLQNYGYGESFTDGFNLNRWENRYAELYLYSDAITNEVWTNAAFETQMLGDKNFDIKNSAWEGYSADQKKDTLIHYYCYWNSSFREQTATYSDIELEAMRMNAFMKACGLDAEALLERVYLEVQEVEYGMGTSEGVAVNGAPTFKIVGTFDIPNTGFGDPDSTIVGDGLLAYYNTWCESVMEKNEDTNGA